MIVLPPTPPALLLRRGVITLIFFLLATAYSVVTPIFEISDEFSHYPVIHYIADTGKLPVQDTARLRTWDWEGAQPPLYYVLSAILVAPINRDDLNQHLIENPHTKTGIGLATDNHNVMLHDWDAQAFPWKGTPLAVHIVRLFSVLLGTGAVWLSFTVARLALPERPAVALVALCVTAFNPMFLAIVGSVNNDNLVIFLTTVVFALVLSMWRNGFTWQRVIALALLCTFAAASKVSGTVLFMPAGLVVLLIILRDKKPFSYVALSAGIFVVVWMGLFGWWYVRNLDLYNEPLATYHMAQTVGLRADPIGIIELFHEEYFSFFAAYWGWFGTLSILAPDTLFDYALLMWVVAAAGLGIYIINSWGKSATYPNGGMKFLRQPHFVPFGLMLVTLGFAFVSLIQWTMTTNASQGRLLFPFVSVISTFTALGLERILGKRLAVYMTAPLMMYTVVSVGYIIPHAFRLPEHLDTLPKDAQAVDVRYDDIELLGYKVDNNVVYPEKDTLTVTLYWRPTAQTDQPFSLYIQAFASGDDGSGDLDGVVEVGKVDSYPARGMLRSDTWETGVIYEDVYRLEIKNYQGHTPFEPRLKIGWRDNETDVEIPATTLSGESINAVILHGGRVSSGDRDVPSGREATFGDAIRLHDASITQGGAGLTVNVYWEALHPIPEDFTVFVQLVDAANPSQPIAFGDGVPRGGWWRTSLWIPDEAFSDEYFIALDESLPDGAYQVLIGFYRPADFTRLPVNVPPYPDAYAIDLTIGE